VSHPADASPPDSQEARIEATARAQACALLSDLFHQGPRGALLEAAAASPLLAEALAQYEKDDDLEADHQEAFGLQVFPMAGVFLDATGRAGAGAEALTEQYAALGIVDRRGEADGADHLATLLGALAVANAALADPTRFAWAGEQSRFLLERHLLSWLPAWVSAVRRLALPWPTALADQVLELALLQFAQASPREKPTAPSDLPALPDLDEPDTDLTTIAEALTCAARAGLFLSRKDLARLAQRSRTPTGFGPRSELLRTALREGAHLETLTALLYELAALYRAWIGELSALERGPMRELAALLAPWRKRSEEVLVLLGRLESSVTGECA